MKHFGNLEISESLKLKGGSPSVGDLLKVTSLDADGFGEITFEPSTNYIQDLQDVLDQSSSAAITSDFTIEASGYSSVVAAAKNHITSSETFTDKGQSTYYGTFGTTDGRAYDSTSYELLNGFYHVDKSGRTNLNWSFETGQASDYTDSNSYAIFARQKNEIYETTLNDQFAESSNTIQIEDVNGSVNGSISVVSRGVGSTDSLDGINLSYSDTSISSKLLKLTMSPNSSGSQFTDSFNSQGLKYAADYSTNGIANAGDRWIPDAGWVNSKIPFVGSFATGNEPTASSYPNGFYFYRTTDTKPYYTDGTNWRDAMGNLMV